MLAMSTKEANDDLDYLRDDEEVTREVRSLAERALGSLESMQLMLEHIGAVVYSPASAYGYTPLMSP